MKDKQLNVRIPDYTLDDLNFLCTRFGMSQSDLICRFIRAFRGTLIQFDSNECNRDQLILLFYLSGDMYFLDLAYPDC